MSRTLKVGLIILGILLLGLSINWYYENYSIHQTVYVYDSDTNLPIANAKAEVTFTTGFNQMPSSEYITDANGLASFSRRFYQSFSGEEVVGNVRWIIVKKEGYQDGRGDTNGPNPITSPYKIGLHKI